MFSAFRQSSKFVRLGNLFRHQPQYLPTVNTPAFFCTESVTTQGPNVAAIANGDKELEHKLKVLVLEVDVLRQEGKLVPEESFLKDNHWKELLKLPSYTSRRRYLEFLFKIEKKKENKMIKKQKKKEERGEKPEKKKEETFEEFVSQYDLAHNSIFLRFYETTINQFYNNRLIQAMQFGQKLVVDCGYDNSMTDRENKNCAKQLTFLFSENRSHDDPFDLHYCNINPNSILMQSLHKHIGTVNEPWFPLHLHESSYLDKFPKEQLVYLTPHCREEMLEYDHDAIYIIGAIVDKVNTEPLSLAKAKREKIRMAKLPLDRYLHWGSGSGKSLTINQVISILLDVKTTGDWKYALRHVPRRKVHDSAGKPEGQRKIWTPAKNELSKLSYRSKNATPNRMVKVRNIIND
jgi:ribonuclease P protein 1